jgi:threonine aldolase
VVVDMRSDTLTMPTAAMRKAMSEAELGDDVFGEDPNVNRLQERAAEVLGKEAAVFVPSGTMANLIGVLVNARNGQEVIADADSHLFLLEGAGTATVGGIQVRPVPTPRGVMQPEQVAAVIRPTDDVHQPLSAAVCVEDTHNRHGGVVWPLRDLRAVSDLAHARGLRVHLDGARLFNAAVALDVPAREIADCADTVAFCLSKGLGAPVGSLLCGERDRVDAAVRWRKLLGGGWREAGMLAAAGLLALDMVDRLAEDHANARTLAEGLAELPGIDLDLSRVETNIVRFRVTGMPTDRFLAECEGRGVRGAGSDASGVRFVTHLGVDTEGIQHALAVCSEVLSA